MKSLALPGVPIAALHVNNAHPSSIPPPTRPPNLSRQHLFRRRRIISVASMPRLGLASGGPGGVMWRGERKNFKKILKKFAE